MFDPWGIKSTCFIILRCQQQGAAWLGYVFIVVRAMQTAHTTTRSLFPMVFFCKHNITIRVYIKINVFDQVILLHTLSKSPAGPCPFLWQEAFPVKNILRSEDRRVGEVGGYH